MSAHAGVRGSDGVLVRLLLPMLLTACGTIGLDTDTSAPVDTGVLAPFRVDSLEPAWGPTSGGTQVTVSGAGFQGDVTVSFGNTALTVTVIDDATLLLLTPAVQVEAAVDMTIDSQLGRLIVPDAFTYSNSAPDTGDSGDSGGDSGEVTPTGLVGGLVELDYMVVACPSCFGLTSAQQVQVDATAAFHEPVSASWMDWMPPNGSCVVDPVRTDASAALLDVGDHAYLELGSSLSIDLRRSGDGWYTATGLATSDYVKNAAYDLSVSDGGVLGAHSVTAAVLTTTGFDSLGPESLMEDSARAFAPLSASSHQFTWSPTGVSDAVVVDMLVFDSNGEVQRGEILCVSDDVGALQIPSSAFSNFYEGDLAAVYLYRWQTSSSVRAIDGATIEGSTGFGLLGTATLRP